jgi:DNA-binding NarL/FixJ family response regulator
MHRDKNYVTAMLRVGVSGYVLKDCDGKELVNAVREVVAGRGYISPEVAPLILADYSGQLTTAGNNSDLNTKEVEVLRLLSDGLSIKDIAEKLNVSGKTVERSRNQIMEKLNLHSIAELTKYAIKKGISTLG